MTTTTVVGLILGLAQVLPGPYATPLDDYVNRPDPTYKYDVLDVFQGSNYKLYTINMTSQTWKPDLQSQPVWWHYLSVTVPDKLDLGKAGFLFIDGCHNGGT